MYKIYGVYIVYGVLVCTFGIYSYVHIKYVYVSQHGHSIFPKSGQTQMRIRSIVNQSYIGSMKQFPSSKKDSGNICNSSEKKFSADRTAFIWISKIWRRMTYRFVNRIHEPVLFFTLYLRLPPRQYETRVWPIKGGSHLLRASL